MTAGPFAHLERMPLRAAILGEAVRYAAERPGLILATEILAHLLRWTGKPEEDVGPDLFAALTVLVRMGVFQTNRPDGLHGGIIIAANTRIGPGHLLIGYLFDDGRPAAANDVPSEVEP